MQLLPLVRTNSAVGAPPAELLNPRPAPATSRQSGSSALFGTAPTAVLSTAGAALLARGRQRRAVRGKLVATRDGATWGEIGHGCNTTIDTSGPLPFVKLTRMGDEAIIYLLGACVTSYKTDGTEWLAVRPDAKLDGSKPISGGLPHCFPQFGPGEIQQHGFARNLEWKLLEEPSEGGVCVLELTDTEETRKMWPHAFRCEYRIELQEGRLATTLKVENTSTSTFSFQAALHSYYKVFNIQTCSVTGDFKGATKLDKTNDPVEVTKGESDKLTFSKFTEEIYKGVLPGTVTVSDEKGDLDIVSGGGWRDVVIWNPYGDKGMGADEFVCVESAEIAQVPLERGAVWEATMDLVAKPTPK